MSFPTGTYRPALPPGWRTCTQCGKAGTLDKFVGKRGHVISNCEGCMVKREARAPLLLRRIDTGTHVQHIPTGAVRRVSGRRGEIVHFAQVIKTEGTTLYWAHADECLRVYRAQA